jgi:hypothetical protein
MVLQSKRLLKQRFQDKGFNHLLSLNSVIYLKNSKLDVDLGYVANDRSEFVDSDVAGLHMKLKTLITMRSTICLNGYTGINCWNSRNASN